MRRLPKWAEEEKEDEENRDGEDENGRRTRVQGGMMMGLGGRGAFLGTRALEIVKKHDSGSLVWKRIKLTSTRKANAKSRLLHVWQDEAVLKACSEPPPSRTNGSNAQVPKTGETS